MNCERSSKRDVKSGVPQGSVLGPILFVIFINDLPDCVRSLFADETKIFNEVRYFSDGELLQQDLFALENWSEKWLRPFLPKKAEALHIAKSRLGRKYYAENECPETIEEDTTKVELGVTFDNVLKFEMHILNKVNKANKIFGLIRSTFTSLTVKNSDTSSVP